jgi:histidinol-phosphate aminotransferase
MTFDELARPEIQGLMTYEPGRPIEEVARELGFESADAVIKLASNENALGPSARAISAMRAAAGTMHRYPDGGAFYLKQGLAGALGLQPAQILPTNGSNEALELLGHVFLGAGTSIVMADCAFVVYRLTADMFGAETIAVPMRDFVHDLDAMLDAIRPDTRLVFVSNPNNPTSTVVTPEAIARFMDRVPDHVVVCFDEAYVELLDVAEQPDTLAYVRAGRNAAVLRTFSKTYGLAGLRVGYVAAPEPCVALLNKVRQPFNLNAMAQAAAVAALEDRAHVERTRELVRAGLRQLRAGFEALGLESVPAVANFILVKTGRGREVFGLLQKAGVIVRPMDGYGLPEYVRVTVGTQDENAACLRALRTVLQG